MPQKQDLMLRFESLYLIVSFHIDKRAEKRGYYIFGRQCLFSKVPRG